MPAAAPVSRVYRMAWWVRLLGVVFLAMGTCVSVSTLGKYGWNQIFDITINDAAPLLFVLVGIGITAHAFATRVLFTQEGLEKRNLLGKQLLPFSAIRGRREYSARNNTSKGGSTTYLRLVSCNVQYPTVDVMKNGYNWDEAFWRWYNSLDDLDALDQEGKGTTSNFGLV